VEALAQSLKRLIQEFAKLPGVGSKTAERFAYHVLDLPTEDALQLARALYDVKKKMRKCSQCNFVSESETCPMCSSPDRNRRLLCVVETSRDVARIENLGQYDGLYHVLGGTIAPLEGVGPDDLNVSSLLTRLENDGFTEVVLATNPTLEGDATAEYLAAKLKRQGLTVSRLAKGMPAGSTIDHASRAMLTDALKGRHEI